MLLSGEHNGYIGEKKMLERKVLVIVLGETFAELPMKIKATCTGTKYLSVSTT
jgi:hypothetical protein